MEDPNKDLKNKEEEDTSTDADLSDKKTPEPSDDTKESDDQVEVSKSELEQLRKDANEKENYRKAVIRLNKAKGRNLPGLEPVKKPKADDDFGFDDKKVDTDNFVTKDELALRDEKRAISDSCKEEEILLNWDEIIVFYQRPKDSNYVTQLAAIQNAHKLWRADNNITDTPDNKVEIAKKAKQELASEKGLSKGKEKKPEPSKKKIIPPKEKMEDWYQ